MSKLSQWSAEEVAAKLSGTGRSKSQKTGDGWKAPCPAHDDRTPSLSLKNSNGKLLWHCFAGCDSEDVRKAIEEKIGGEEPTKREEGGTHKERDREKVEDPRKTVYPVPESAHYVFDDFQHRTYGAPSQLWTYRTAEGVVAGWIARYDLADGDKEIIPFVWTRHEQTGKEEPAMRSMPEPRPLYNLDKIASDRDAVIMFSEGEKSADAAEELFPEWIHTTLPGGCNAIRLADLSPLEGRTVIVLPDHDASGYDLMLKLSLMLPRSTDLRMMVWPRHWPREEGGERPVYVLKKGDDAFDHVKAGWTRDKLRAAVAESGQPLAHRLQDLPDPFELSHRR